MTVTLPSPRTPDPMAAPPLRWGILGPGWIAEQMVGALRAHTRQEVVAVGSRDVCRARAFAQRHGIARRHGSYENLVGDPEVDIVYVASPHSGHREHALLALDAGKHVLIEKAFARNAAEARDIVERARALNLFCMEAMWTRFLPGTDVIRQCLEQGLLGPVEVVFADHGQPLHPDGPQRLSDPDLAGGALLDLGIYPVSFASFALGGLTAVTAVGELAETGVDAREAMIVTGTQGGTGVLHATMTARTETMASIVGREGRLDIGERTQFADSWYGPTVIRHQGRTAHEPAEWRPADDTSDPHHVGLHYEACEAARCIADGLLESALLPLDETVALMGILDEVRRQIGVRYPGE